MCVEVQWLTLQCAAAVAALTWPPCRLPALPLCPLLSRRHGPSCNFAHGPEELKRYRVGYTTLAAAPAYSRTSSGGEGSGSTGSGGVRTPYSIASRGGGGGPFSPRGGWPSDYASFDDDAVAAAVYTAEYELQQLYDMQNEQRLLDQQVFAEKLQAAQLAAPPRPPPPPPPPPFGTGGGRASSSMPPPLDVPGPQVGVVSSLRTAYCATPAAPCCPPGQYIYPPTNPPSLLLPCSPTGPPARRASSAACRRPVCTARNTFQPWAPPPPLPLPLVAPSAGPPL
jgi:hypothetical protein